MTAVRPGEDNDVVRRLDIVGTLLTEDGRTADLGGRSAYVGSAWEIPFPDDDSQRRIIDDAGGFADPDNPQDVFYAESGGRSYLGQPASEDRPGRIVVAIGLSADEVLELAGGVRFADGVAAPVRVGAAVPVGLAVAVSGIGPFSAPPEHLVEWATPTGRVQLRVLRADPALAALWAWWLDEPIAVELTAGVGWDGSVANDEGWTAPLPYADGALVLAGDGVVASLVGGSEDEREMLAGQLRSAPISEFAPLSLAAVSAESPCSPGQDVLTGIVDGVAPVRWHTCFIEADPPDRVFIAPGLTFPAGNSGEGFRYDPELAPAGELTLVLHVADAAEDRSDPRSGLFVVGVAPPGTTSYAVTVDGAAVTAERQLATSGPSSGGVWFAAYVTDPDPVGGAIVSVEALGADGRSLATRTAEIPS